MKPDRLTSDTLLGGKVRLQQPAEGYRTAIDPVFLAASIRALPGEKLLELGCGAGAASLCLARRVPLAAVAGIDLQAELVALARSNAAANGMADQLSFLQGDVRDPPKEVAAGRFDQVFANPPFLKAEQATIPASGIARVSELEGTASLHDWLDAMLRLVRPKGRVTLIHRADRIDDILHGLRGRAGEITLFPLWPKEGVPAKRVIVSARRGVKSPMRLQPGLTLHDADGAYTPDADNVLRRGLENAGVWV